MAQQQKKSSKKLLRSGRNKADKSRAHLPPRITSKPESSQPWVMRKNEERYQAISNVMYGGELREYNLKCFNDGPTLLTIAFMKYTSTRLHIEHTTRNFQFWAAAEITRIIRRAQVPS